MSIVPMLPYLAAIIIGEFIASLLVRRYFSNKNYLKIGEDLMRAVESARRDVINANKLLDEMEATNLDLRQKNSELTKENLTLTNTLAQIKSQLNNALDDIDYWMQLYQKEFPNKGQKPNKIN